MSRIRRSYKACDHYEPNWAKWDAEGNMCSGFGASPDCKNCGLDEHHHWLEKALEKLEDPE